MKVIFFQSKNLFDKLIYIAMTQYGLLIAKVWAILCFYTFAAISDFVWFLWAFAVKTLK